MASATAPQSPMRLARKARGLTQEDLARLAGVTLRTVIRLEQGENQPQAQTARSLADALGVPVESLTTGTGDVPSGGDPLSTTTNESAPRRVNGRGATHKEQTS